MFAPQPRYRVVDKTPLEASSCREFFVECFRDGAWHLAIFDAMWICCSDREKAEHVAEKLERGEDISEDVKRKPVRWWQKPGWDPSKQVRR